MQPLVYLSACAALIVGAVADFSVYDYQEIDQIPGSGAQSQGIKVKPNRENSCGDMCGGRPNFSFHNDATRNAYACTGCSAGQNSQDWDIQQFEFNNEHGGMFNEDVVFITLRKGNNGEYTVHGRRSLDEPEEQRQGELCFRESQVVGPCQCPQYVADGNKLFWCQSGLTTSN